MLPAANRWPTNPAASDLSNYDAHEADGPFIAVIRGPGGIGKTALALSFAHRLYDSFPDGQLFVRVAEWDADPSIAVPGPLEAAPDERLARVARALVLALRRPGEDVPDVSQRDELLRLLQEKAANHALIIVLDDAPADVDLSPILNAIGATSTIVVTARQQPSHISADFDEELQPLLDVDSLRILERAIGRDRVQEESDAARRLVELCHREPLALALAGAALAIRPHWKLSLVVKDLAGQVTTGTDPRHAGSFDAAYWMLTEDEQHALRCIGAIGTARIAPWALQATLGDADGYEARAVAARLARTGLIDRTNSGAGGVPVYEVPESVAAYAWRLTDEEEKTRARARLGEQRDRRRLEEPTRQIREQVYPLLREGQLREAIERARDALALTRDNPDHSAEAVCFAALAEIYAEFGEMSAAEDAAERALRIGEPASRARAYRTLGKLKRRVHLFADAENNLDRALGLAEQAGDPGEEIRVLAERAIVRARTENFGQALEDARRARELCAYDEERQQPVALLSEGAVYLYMGASRDVAAKSRAASYALSAKTFATGVRPGPARRARAKAVDGLDKARAGTRRYRDRRP
jgi:hypothetical protein